MSCLTLLALMQRPPDRVGALKERRMEEVRLLRTSGSKFSAGEEHSCRAGQGGQGSGMTCEVPTKQACTTCGSSRVAGSC